MRLSVRNIEGKGVGRIDVRDDVFGAPANPALVHQVVVGHRANARQGTADTKTRARVSGGGRKPRPQKGTGSARAGSTSSPIWRGGGVVFGPHPRSYGHRTPKRMRRMSIVSVLSDKVRDGELIVVDELALEEARTKDLVAVLDALGARVPTLLVADHADRALLRAARNIQRVKTLPPALLNTLDLLNNRTIVMTVGAARKAEETFGGARRRRRGQVRAAA